MALNQDLFDLADEFVISSPVAQQPPPRTRNSVSRTTNCTNERIKRLDPNKVPTRRLVQIR